MARRPDDPATRTDAGDIDASLRAAFKRVEAQPTPEKLKDHIDRLTTQTRGKARD